MPGTYPSASETFPEDERIKEDDCIWRYFRSKLAVWFDHRAKIRRLPARILASIQFGSVLEDQSSAACLIVCLPEWPSLHERPHE